MGNADSRGQQVPQKETVPTKTKQPQGGQRIGDVLYDVERALKHQPCAMVAVMSDERGNFRRAAYFDGPEPLTLARIRKEVEDMFPTLTSESYRLGYYWGKRRYDMHREDDLRFMFTRFETLLRGQRLDVKHHAIAGRFTFYVRIYVAKVVA